MQARLTFKDEVEFVQDKGWTVRVRLGKSFTMLLLAPSSPNLEWATTKDKVLEVEETNAITAEITCLKAGTAKVMLLNSSLASEFHLNIEVFDPEAQRFAIPAPTTEPIQ